MQDVEMSPRAEGDAALENRSGIQYGGVLPDNPTGTSRTFSSCWATLPTEDEMQLLFSPEREEEYQSIWQHLLGCDAYAKAAGTPTSSKAPFVMIS